MSFPVPRARIRRLNEHRTAKKGRHVLYWMTAFRRPRWNFALDRAVELARESGTPLLVLEPLRCGYPHASDRLHRFVIDGMAANRAAFAAAGVAYHPYVEPSPGAARGLLAALASDAAAVVTDDHPGFIHPRMIVAAARVVPCAFEAVDANGIMPLALAGGPHPSAYVFRRLLQKSLAPHLTTELPAEHPLEALREPEAHDVGAPVAAGSPGAMAEVPAGVLERWPAASDALLAGDAGELARLPIDHAVAPVAKRGGFEAAHDALRSFLETRFDRYAGDRNEPDDPVTSGLSPWLHFGYISSHEIFASIAAREGWRPARLSRQASGKRAGWWGMGESAEAFLDQLVTWRELGFVECVRNPAYREYESLPAWARATLEKHAADPRPARYTVEELDGARTHDGIWNAAQRELVREGAMHNYLRMLWGKKILEWSASPRDALEIMIHLNDRYALDGRDPNSYSGITWVMGRYDRPWGPERPVFGTVRYMSSENTARKLRLRKYLARYAAQPEPGRVLTDRAES